MIISFSITNILVSSGVIVAVSALLGIMLGVVAEKFKVVEDERIDKVKAFLAGSNCGGCGFPGCDACAKAMVEGKAAMNACPTANTAEIAAILGVAEEKIEKKVAFIRCSGDSLSTTQMYNYTDEKTCVICFASQGHGPKQCRFSCCGFGECAAACKYGAITVVNGLAKSDPSKCVGCSACVKACPMGLIELIPTSSAYVVACSSCDKGKDVRASCEKGCIGCGLCARICPSGAITVTDNLAYIDQEKCTHCGLCAEKCPAKVIVKR